MQLLFVLAFTELMCSYVFEGGEVPQSSQLDPLPKTNILMTKPQNADFWEQARAKNFSAPSTPYTHRVYVHAVVPFLYAVCFLLFELHPPPPPFPPRPCQPIPEINTS